jgi:hypothetical protein
MQALSAVSLGGSHPIFEVPIGLSFVGLPLIKTPAERSITLNLVPPMSARCSELGEMQAGTCFVLHASASPPPDETVTSSLVTSNVQNQPK